MTALALSLIEQGTGGGDGRVTAAASKLVTLVPVSFAIAGALTGATAAVAPPSVFDWTSSGVHRIENPAAWASLDTVAAAPSPAPTATQALLQSIKMDSGLTWGQIADAMGVEARAIHLWRNGGGISAAHEARLHDLGFLIGSVQLREQSDARNELVGARSGQSLLGQFGGGAAPRELALLAPWRIEARDGLIRSVEARMGGEPVDEDYAFLLYADDAAVAEFAMRSTALLEDPATSRLAWDAEIDAQFDRVEQPPAIMQDTSEEPDGRSEFERYGPPPLFGLEDLGITLGVGAIASRPSLHEGR